MTMSDDRADMEVPAQVVAKQTEGLAQQVRQSLTAVHLTELLCY